MFFKSRIEVCRISLFSRNEASLKVTIESSVLNLKVGLEVIVTEDEPFFKIQISV